ncbi:MAG TPA: YdiU family protein [Kofleriaceae bacterium]|nr:YdiU family protein [Kofleriaceae bacterium]
MSPTYRPAPRIEALGGRFYDPARPARFPALRLRFRNQRWAERVGLGALTPAEWEAAFARFEPLPGNLSRPLALRYHGHQFRHYNAQLGDGRGFLYAQLLDDRDRLLDLGTKGSGQTPWSRGGDGRLTLKGGVREVLATEMLEALGVETSKTFSLFETGESLVRNDEPSPTRASVLVRLGHSHLRFGSFQRHAYLGHLDSLRALLAFSIEHYAPELCDAGEHAAALFLRLVVNRSARLCAQWMAAGFVHGVLNSDNMNITGESFDYGPYRFLPVLDPGFTAAYFDHTGLYAYGQQPASVKWNLVQLALALEPIADPSLRVIVERFDYEYEAALDAAVLARLGVQSRGPLPDRLLRTEVFELLDRSALPFERLFFDWYGGAAAEARARRSGLDYSSIRDALRSAQPAPGAHLDHPYFQQGAPCTLLIDEIESIWDAIAERDDWTAFEGKVAAIRAMGEALAPA